MGPHERAEAMVRKRFPYALRQLRMAIELLETDMAAMDWAQGMGHHRTHAYMCAYVVFLSVMHEAYVAAALWASLCVYSLASYVRSRAKMHDWMQRRVKVVAYIEDEHLGLGEEEE